MEWIKFGNIYNIENGSGWRHSHTHKPTVLVLEKKIRVYFGVRDESNHTRTTYVDLNKEDLTQVIYEHNNAVLDLGELGAFDDEGANVSSIVMHNEDLYMYFIGWNTGKTVPSRNASGLAISNDKGENFKRISDGPVMGINRLDPFFVVAPFVIIEDSIWKMWYTSGTSWKVINEKPEIHYHIKYAESSDGIVWDIQNISAIPPAHEFECTARPSVIKYQGKYHMWFSHRSMVDFRTSSGNSYRIGYAHSEDGISWVREKTFSVRL